MNVPKTETTLTGGALIAAILVVLVWLVFLWWLAFHVAATDTQWSRLVSILSSLEAVAFAAAGALFGTSIGRQRVRDAKERADKAEERATEAGKSAAANIQAAANGKALATAVKAHRRTKSAGQGIERTSAAEANDELLILASTLFPE